MSIEHFRIGFERAVARSKEPKSKPHTQHAVQKVTGNVITATTKATTSNVNATFKLSEEEYRTSLIAKAIAHIHKQKGVM